MENNEEKKIFIVSWIEKLVGVVDKFGMKRIFQAFAVMMGFFVMDLALNICRSDIIIGKLNGYTQTEHMKGSELRDKVNPEISQLLTRMVMTTKCDRAFVFEFHNGKENPTNLPFSYCDMTYEEINENDTLSYISKEYENLNLSKYNFPEYLKKNIYFVGSIEDIRKIDKKIASRLDIDNVKYMACVMIKSNVDIGFMGMSFSKKPEVSDGKLYAILAEYCQDMSRFLDFNSQKGE